MLTTLGFKFIGIRKSEFVAKNQLLSSDAEFYFCFCVFLQMI